MKPLLRTWVVGLVGAWVGAGVASADTSEWESVSFPLQTTRASVSTNFDPGNPVIVVTYSNASPDYVLAVWTPKLDWEQVIHVPSTVFDGKERRKEDHVRIDLEDGPDLVPRNWTNLMPGEVIRLSCVVSNRYRLPPEWETMAVDLGAQNQLVDERFVFNRTGKLLEVKVLRQRDLDAMKRSAWEYRRQQSSRASTADTAARSAKPTNEWADAHVPVVECSVRAAPDFNPADPIFMVTYSNTSDRCPAYELVPVMWYDRMALDLEVLFDAKPAEDLNPEIDIVPASHVEIPPLTAVSVAYRIGDMCRRPPTWNRITIAAPSANAIRLWWFEFDRSGREVARGLYRETPYEDVLGRNWRWAARRDRILADIMRYASMRSNGITMLPRIGTTFTPTGLANPVADVYFVSNTLPYVRPERAVTNVTYITDDPLPPAPRPRSRLPWWPYTVAAALALVVWAVARRRAMRGGAGDS